MKAKKRFGQHFLTDPSFIHQIIEVADIQPEEIVLEIGPGTGNLTRALAQKARRVVAIELDRELVTFLQNTFATTPNVEIYQGDALEFPYPSLFSQAKVVANLPYNIASPLLLRLLEYSSLFSRILVMVQKEVAERIVSLPGRKSYGVLSLLVQYRARARICFLLPPAAFSPRPNVFSAFLESIPYSTPPVTVHDESLFVRTVKAAFAHRRKTLKNSLKQAFSAEVNEQLLTEVLDKLGIEERRRAETLTREDFAALSNCLWSHLSRTRSLN